MEQQSMETRSFCAEYVNIMSMDVVKYLIKASLREFFISHAFAVEMRAVLVGVKGTNNTIHTYVGEIS